MRDELKSVGESALRPSRSPAGQRCEAPYGDSFSFSLSSLSQLDQEAVDVVSFLDKVILLDNLLVSFRGLGSFFLLQFTDSGSGSGDGSFTIFDSGFVG